MGLEHRKLGVVGAEVENLTGVGMCWASQALVCIREWCHWRHLHRVSPAAALARNGYGRSWKVAGLAWVRDVIAGWLSDLILTQGGADGGKIDSQVWGSYRGTGGGCSRAQVGREPAEGLVCIESDALERSWWGF